MTALNAGQRRTAALALLALLAVVLYLLVLQPLYQAFRENSDQIAELQHQLEVYQRVAEQLPQHQRTLDQLQQDDPTRGFYLAEKRPALAAAQLQQRINQAVEKIGGQVVSTQIMSGSSEGAPLPQVGIQVHLRGETEHLVKLLYRIAYDSPLLSIDNLNVIVNQRVNRRARRQSGRRGGTVSAPAGSLDIRFNLIGYTERE